MCKEGFKKDSDTSCTGKYRTMEIVTDIFTTIRFDKPSFVISLVENILKSSVKLNSQRTHSSAKRTSPNGTYIHVLEVKDIIMTKTIIRAFSNR